MISKTMRIAVLALAAAACKPGGLQESDDHSGLYSLGVQGGSNLQGQGAVDALNQFCSPAALPGYIQKIAHKISFNAGYAEHPNAGYDAALVQKQGPDGDSAFYIGEGQMHDGAGSLAMFPPTNGNINRLIAGYCNVALQSLGGAAPGTKSGSAKGCAYPQIAISQGGSVSGSSAKGQISSSGCIIAKMQNDQIKHTAEIAFCPDAIGGNFFSKGDGAAGEMSIIIR